MYLLHLQGKLHHLSPHDKKTLIFAVLHWIRGMVIRKRVEDFQLGIESYQTQLNLTRPRWEFTAQEPVPDYTVVESPAAVIFRDRYNIRMVMHLSELHKFSDGTLKLVEEALDYRVKEYKIFSTRPGRYTSDWTKRDLQNNNKFLHAIRKRLRSRRIFRNLECYVGGRVRAGDYRLVQRTE